MKRYRITRRFIGGILNGMTYTENTSVFMPVGFTCLNPVGGSPYQIVAVEPLPQ